MFGWLENSDLPDDPREGILADMPVQFCAYEAALWCVRPEFVSSISGTGAGTRRDCDRCRESSKTSSKLTLSCEYGASEVSKISTNLEVDMSRDTKVVIGIVLVDINRCLCVECSAEDRSDQRWGDTRL